MMALCSYTVTVLRNKTGHKSPSRKTHEHNESTTSNASLHESSSMGRKKVWNFKANPCKHVHEEDFEILSIDGACLETFLIQRHKRSCGIIKEFNKGNFQSLNEDLITSNCKASNEHQFLGSF